jgi:hypothetical protein
LPGGAGRENRSSPATQPLKAKMAEELASAERKAILKTPAEAPVELDDVPPLEPFDVPKACTETYSCTGCLRGTSGVDPAGADSMLNSGNSGQIRLPCELSINTNRPRANPEIHGMQPSEAERICLSALTIGVLRGVRALGYLGYYCDEPNARVWQLYWKNQPAITQ